MVSRFLIQNAEAVPGVRGQSAGNKRVLYLIEIPANHDQSLRRRIAVAALPEGIDAADYGRQAILRAVEIHRAGFAIISGKNSKVSTVFRRKYIANFSDGFDKF